MAARETGSPKLIPRNFYLPARRTPPHGAGPGRRRGAPGRQQPAPEPPAWLVERGIGAGRLPVRLHTGDCWDTGNRCVPAGAEQVRGLLAEGVPACIHCRPDTALGMLE
ncbi:DUF6233 domain-containing protein [Streptomyces sp. NPDC046685]|uniref:DUF6233 domain-containing protein n=1 Tax=Streptomyces sp. NPDC046685 TaxID=3157202 RepID=UPI0033F9DECC